MGGGGGGGGGEQGRSMVKLGSRPCEGPSWRQRSSCRHSFESGFD